MSYRPVTSSARLVRRLGLAAAATILLSSHAQAGTFDIGDEPSRRLSLSGLLDVRYAHTSQTLGWLSGGVNRLRYGGKDTDNNASGDRDAHVFAVPQMSLVLDAPVPLDASVHAQLNLDADSDSGGGSAGLVEAYAAFDGSEGERSWRARLGALIPPISWEHPGKAWSTRHTLTPSAIGSWIGEEVRGFGAEGSYGLKYGPHSARVTGGLFSGGDQTGWILFERGWGLHDYQSTLNETVPLPNNKTERPFLELDGRPGHYERLNLSFSDDLLKLGGGFWDNEGDPGAYRLEGTSSLAVWSTEFWDAGAQLQWRRWLLLSQFVSGRSSMVKREWTGWQAWYGLAAYRLGAWTLSGRYDDFDVHKGGENGYALTACLQWDRNKAQRLSAEFLHAYARPGFAVRDAQKDELLQLNARFFFGD